MKQSEAEDRAHKIISSVLDKTIVELIGMEEIRWYWSRQDEFKEEGVDLLAKHHALLCILCQSKMQAVLELVAEIEQLTKENYLLELDNQSLREILQDTDDW